MFCPYWSKNTRKDGVNRCFYLFAYLFQLHACRKSTSDSSIYSFRCLFFPATSYQNGSLSPYLPVLLNARWTDFSHREYGSTDASLLGRPDRRKPKYYAVVVWFSFSRVCLFISRKSVVYSEIYFHSLSNRRLLSNREKLCLTVRSQVGFLFFTV